MISSQQIIQMIEELAPKTLALDWDNPGLAIGDYSKKISKILLTLTVTPEAINHAIDNGFEMLISHHPMFFKPIKSIRADLPQGKMIYQAVKNDLIIYSAHTNLDIAFGGVNDALADVLGLKDTRVLTKTHQEKLNKVVVFVPKSHEEAVRNAMGSAGAGFIGNYSHCSFSLNGKGTFKPLAGTKPYIGETDKLEMVDEVRIETIAQESITKKVVNAIIKAHPYEEVAYDIYPLENEGQIYGLGRVGKLDKPMTLKDFCQFVKQKLDAKFLKVTGKMDKTVSKVALCGGAAGDLIENAAFCGADVYLTGDVKYHQAEDARVLDIAVIDAGHFYTENLVMPYLKQYLDGRIKQAKQDAEIQIYTGKDPFIFV